MNKIDVFTPSYERFRLPSNGLAGVTFLDIRPMTMKEERMLTNKTKMAQGTVHKSIMESVIGGAFNADDEPVPFNLNDLFLEDEYAILLFIRAISYGFDYDVELVCPACNRKEDITVNLETDLPIKYADPSDKPFVEVMLPVAKKRVVIKYPTVSVAEGKSSVSEFLPSLIVDAEGVAPEALSMWAENSLIGRDIAVMRKAIEEPPFGAAKKIKYVCTNSQCSKAGEEQELPLPITPEFFRL